MSRNNYFVRLIPLLSIFLLSFTPFAFGEDNLKPNIVVILADDLGWGDVGWHGSEIKTPHLDRLADAGMKLEQFYVHPVCSPTRACLMTGRYTMRYGLQVSVIFPWADYGLPTDERTMADALREAGYFTAICGKWHLGERRPEYLPLKRGFDYHYGHYLGAIDYYTHERDESLDWHRNGEPVREEGYSTNLIAEDAVRLIENHDMKKPFFLYVPFNAVHSPFQSPPEEELNKPYENLPKPRNDYAGMVASMDANIGKITKAIEKKGIKDNTIIFFCSDNGGPDPGKITSNGPLRGGKFNLYEGGVRVPACIAWPDKIKPKTVSTQPMHIVDLFPTFVTLADGNLEQKKPLDGIDLKDALIEQKTLSRKELLINAAPCTGAIRIGDWKLVINGGVSSNAVLTDDKKIENRTRDSLRLELFNLADDPYEKNNLAKTNPEKLDELFERYQKYAKEAVPILNHPQPRNFKKPDIWGNFD